MQVLSRGEGEMVVVKRPPTKQPAYEYLPCPYCYGFYSKKTLAKHVKSCPLYEGGDKECNAHALGQTLLAAQMQSKPAADEDLDDILSGLNETKANPGKR